MAWLRQRRAWFVAVPVATLLLSAAMLWYLNSYLDAPLAVAEEGVSFDVAPGTAFARISRELESRAILRQPKILNWYARLSGKAESVRAGEYLIEAGATPRSLLEKFVSGEVQLYAFTIVEGWTYRELIAALTSHIAIQSTMVYEDWPAILESLTSSYAHPEGLFLPETYLFPKNSKDTDVLAQAFDTMQGTLEAEWQDRDQNLPFQTPYEALILASIIEKETALASERPRISGVFVRRLQRRMRLQTDPTVIYGIGEEFDGNLTRKHLRTDTAYNTYTRHGLPPTPIALPGQAAIRAALHPLSGNEVYFVATGLGDGSHKFSQTKAEHDAAVQAYLARQRSSRDQSK